MKLTEWMIFGVSVAVYRQTQVSRPPSVGLGAAGGMFRVFKLLFKHLGFRVEGFGSLQGLGSGTLVGLLGV